MMPYGATVTLTALATAGATCYVWELWDGTVQVTVANSLDTVANRAGAVAYTVSSYDTNGILLSAFTRSDTIDAPAAYPVVARLRQLPDNVGNDGSAGSRVYLMAAGADWYRQGASGSGSGSASMSSDLVQLSDSYAINAIGAASTPSSGPPGRVQLREVSINGGVRVTPVDFRLNVNTAPVVSVDALDVPLALDYSAELALTATAQDPDGGPVGFEWLFWDGSRTLGTSTVLGDSVENTCSITIADAAPGEHIVQLVVTDTQLSKVRHAVKVTIPEPA